MPAESRLLVLVLVLVLVPVALLRRWDRRMPDLTAATEAPA